MGFLRFQEEALIVLGMLFAAPIDQGKARSWPFGCLHTKLLSKVSRDVFCKGQLLPRRALSCLVLTASSIGKGFLCRELHGL